MSLEVRGLVKKYGTFTALDLSNVSIKINKGEIFVVIGPSGSGKTTFLRCIAGLEKPDKGVIIINNKTIFDSDKKIMIPPEKRDMGYVPQTWGLWPHMKVFDNIAFGLQLRKVSKEEIRSRVLKVASTLKIEDLLDKYPWQLSGGQQQRVALARALVLEPPIILLDEPISNLDAALREEARLWLKKTLKSIGVTALYVTHDIREAFTLADRIMIIANGKMIKLTTPQNLLSEIDNEVTASLLGFNILKGVVSDIIDKERVKVDIGNISLICETHRRDLEINKSVEVYIHPRDIKVVDEGLRAKVLYSIFTGERYETLIELSSEIVLKMFSDIPINKQEINISVLKCSI